MGRVGADPTINTTRDGKKLANFSVATSKKWTNKQTGEKQESTEWHRVVVYNEKLAEIVENYLKKGDKVYVEGEIKTRKYKDHYGVEKYTTEIVLNGFDGSLVLLSDKREDTQSSQPSSNQPPISSYEDISVDDQIPF